jgi:hypothetical protein
LVSEKVASAVQKVASNLEEKETLKDFERYTNDFIKNTSDFPEYAEKISVWFEEHPEQDDIRTAYEAVKGVFLAEKYKNAEADAAAAAAKELAANAAGGASQSSGTVGGMKEIDKYIGGVSNPNYKI